MQRRHRLAVLFRRFIEPHVQEGQAGKEKGPRLPDMMLQSEGLGMRPRKKRADSYCAGELGIKSAGLLYNQQEKRQLVQGTVITERSCERLQKLWSVDGDARRKHDEFFFCASFARNVRYNFSGR